MVAERREAGTGATKPGLFPWYQGVAILFTVLMIIQAFLGGRGFFKDADLLDAHEMLGSVLLLVAIVQVVLAYLAVGRSMTLWMSGALVVLVIIQMSLGFSAKDGNLDSAAWHLPLGVLIFGIGTSHNALLYRRRG